MHANIGAVVSTLVRKRLIRQTDDPMDRRRTPAITASGIRALISIQVETRSANDYLLCELDNKKRQDRLGTLRLLLRRATKARECAPVVS